MAAKATKLQNTLIVKYKAGVDQKGKELTKKQRFPRIKASASDQDIYDVAREFEKLLGKPVNDILVEQESIIVNE